MRISWKRKRTLHLLGQPGCLPSGPYRGPPRVCRLMRGLGAPSRIFTLHSLGTEIPVGLVRSVPETCVPSPAEAAGSDLVDVKRVIRAIQSRHAPTIPVRTEAERNLSEWRAVAVDMIFPHCDAGGFGSFGAQSTVLDPAYQRYIQGACPYERESELRIGCLTEGLWSGPESEEPFSAPAYSLTCRSDDRKAVAPGQRDCYGFNGKRHLATRARA
jgi:hypothetical protein